MQCIQALNNLYSTGVNTLVNSWTISYLFLLCKFDPGGGWLIGCKIMQKQQLVCLEFNLLASKLWSPARQGPPVSSSSHHVISHHHYNLILFSRHYEKEPKYILHQKLSRSQLKNWLWKGSVSPTAFSLLACAQESTSPHILAKWIHFFRDPLLLDHFVRRKPWLIWFICNFSIPWVPSYSVLRSLNLWPSPSFSSLLKMSTYLHQHEPLCNAIPEGLC